MRRELLDPIAQLDDDRKPWSRFLQKASTGSGKAVDWLSSADMALAERLGGRRLIEKADLGEYDQTLRRALPGSPPFRTIQSLLEMAHAARIVSVRLRAHDHAFHDHAHYDRLWQRGAEVHQVELLHDAAHNAAQHWDGASFRKLVGSVEDTSPGYNSQGVVAAMLYLSAVFAQLPDRH